jgi:hypothetical protein
MSNFVTDCINGDALMSEINDYIERWHESDSNLELHDYLGMTVKEYALFVDDENYLGIIITAHRNNTDIESLVRAEMAIAARSDDASKARKLQKWLENEGLWD